MLTQLLRNWILGLAGASVFCGIMLELCPKGAVKNAVKTVCALVMTIALVSPLFEIDMPSYSVNMAKYRSEGEKIAASAKESADSYSRTIIEEECRAYILDKAEVLGVDAGDVSVRLKWSDEGFWYPVECFVSAPYSPQLAGIIESELGITKDNQEWKKDEGA